jgi:salicylate hydroxylase
MPSPETLLTYPSQSLHFLKSLHDCRATPNKTHFAPQPVLSARLKLDIIVVGAGLGGLAVGIALARRGHSVQVLEQASVLGEVSKIRSVLQLPLNLSR